MAVTFLTDEDKTIIENQIKEIKERFGVETNPNCHAGYFSITDDGELSVMEEYLPEDLVIPEVVNEIAVNKLSSGMFLGNTRIQCVTFPDTIDEIPDECFNQCVNLRHIHNTEHIKKIGVKAFRWTRLEKAIFPNLEAISTDETGESLAFSNVPHLVYVDLGKVTTIPKRTFKHCIHLSKIVGKNVTTVEDEAFYNTYRLANVGFVNQLTSIGDYAYWTTKFDFDWDSLIDCEFAENATYAQIYPEDFWSDVGFIPCENPTPTALCQQNPRWRDKQYGVDTNSDGNVQTYAVGCLQMSAMHAYCGLNNLEYSSVFEFEDVIRSLTEEGETVTFDGEPYVSYLAAQNGSFPRLIVMLEKLGLNVQYYDVSSSAIEKLKIVYRTLSKGGYIILNLDKPKNHAVLVHGITGKGELLVLDSERRYPYNEALANRYKMPFNKLVAPTSNFVTVTQPVAVGVFNVDTVTEPTKIIFYYTWSSSDDVDFVRAGILAVNKDNYNEATFYAGTSDSNVYDRPKPDANDPEVYNPNGVYSWTKTNVPSGQTWISKAYVQYRDAQGNLITFYSDMVEATK